MEEACEKFSDVQLILQKKKKKNSKLKLMKSFLQIDYVKESLSRLIIL